MNADYIKNNIKYEKHEGVDFEIDLWLLLILSASIGVYRRQICF